MASLVTIMSSLIRAPPPPPPPPSSIIVSSNTKTPPSFPCCSIPTRASTLLLTTPSVSNSNSSSSSSSSSRSRFKIAIRWRTRRRRRGLSTSAVFASNSSSPSGSSKDSPNDKSDEKTISTNDATPQPRGPPFLTILAGFLVFFLFVWTFGSIITWLFSFIVKVPTSK